MPQSPDQFLTAVSTGATFNSTGAWEKILAHENITIKDATASSDIDHPSDGNDIWVSLPASWFGLEFSSERNSAYFGPLPQKLSRGNNASTGDSLGSVVLLLRPQATTTSLTLGKVYTSFGIDLGDNSVVSSLLKKIDGSGVMSVTLPDAPDWKAKPATGLTKTIKDRLPTNAVWLTSTESVYYSNVRLSFSLSSDVLDNVLGWVGSKFDSLKPRKIDKHSVTITLNKQSRFSLFDPINNDFIARSTSITVSFDMMSFHVNIDLSKWSRTILLTPTNNGTISSVLTTAFDSSTGDVGDYLPDGTDDNFFNTLFNAVHLWYVRLEIDDHQPAGKQLSWGVGLLAIWKPKSDNIIVALTYDSKTSTFVGRLLTAIDFPGPSDIRQPSWDPRIAPDNILGPAGVDPSTLQGLNLFDLIGLEGDQPPIPHILSAARVSFAKSDNNGSVFTFSADLTREKLITTEEVQVGAPSPFTWDKASVDAMITTSKTDKGRDTAYSLDVFSSFTLNPPTLPPGHDPIFSASFAIGLHCDKSLETGTTWILRAGVRNLSVGLLRSFFDQDSQEGAMAVMDRLTLRSLDVIYTYNGAIASSFLMTGVIILGDLELDLVYQYVSTQVKGPTATQVYLDDAKDDDSKTPLPEKDQYTKGTGKTQMKFLARLSATSPDSTVGSIAESIKKGSRDSLPTWVGDIPVNPSKDGAEPIAELEFSSQTTSDTNLTGNSSVLTVFLNIAGFSLTFVQYHPALDKTAAVDTKRPVKRLLRIAVDQIPTMKDIPLVGQLPQPFDGLEYVWVEDDNPKKGNVPNGISASELQDITSQMPTDLPPFQTKEMTKKESSTPALEAGHHFIVLSQGKVVLDHVFHTDRASSEKAKEDAAASSKNDSSTSADPSGSTSSNPSGGTHAPDAKPVDTVAKKTEEAAPTKGSAQRKAGPLSISAVSLQFKNGSLFISLDATLELGPLTFTVVGFTIEIQLSGIHSLSNLASIVTDGLVHASLHGIEVGVQQGPLTLKGMFIHDVVGDTEKYSGGIAVAFTAWQILAIGQYTIKHADAKGKGGFRAVFVYGKLDGPLITFEFAQISGVRLGFGYNYAVRTPDVNELYSFPFISDSASANSGNDPMKVLDAMVGSDKPFVYVKEKASWFCAGMTITACDLLVLTAVLMVNIDQSGGPDNGVTITLLADGIFQMEPKAPPEFSLFYIEVILSAEFNFAHGYIAVNAVLAPASHVYVPQARLVGGASFTTWFGSNPHAGDWVVTVGGYSRMYRKPDHYPRPQAVGLNFTVGDNIQIIGVGYLAVTPKCAMAGGSLHMSLSVGPVSAYADIMLDAFVNFKPFHFKASISLSVGVECDIDILFIHIHISVHLGADLVVWGPNDFGGRAHVDFWFFGFDISFGASENNVSESIPLLEFWEMVKSPGPNSSPPANDTIGSDTQKTLHKYSVEDGLIIATTPAADGAKQNLFPSTGATKEFQVQAGNLKLRIDCDFPLSTAVLHNHHSSSGHPEADQEELKNLTLPLPPGGTEPPSTPALYSKPMHNDKTKPAITSQLDVWIYKDEGVDKVTKKRIKILQNAFKGELVLKSAASALWGTYDPADDPLVQEKPDALQNGANATIDIVQAVRILPPDPQLYPDPKIKEQTRVVDFDATAAMRSTVPESKSDAPALRNAIANAEDDKKKEDAFAGAYFQPDVPDDDGVKQLQRWKDFGKVWNPAVAAAVEAKEKAKDTTTPIPIPAAVPTASSDTTPPAPATNPTPAAAAAATSVSTDVTFLRLSMVNSIADILEWDKRPPEQMAGASSGPSDASTAARTWPVINADGRFDWELVDGQPYRLVDEIATYYPALPYVLAGAA